MSKTAFILRLLYRSYRNPRTNLCDLPDVKVREITGWDLHAVKMARELLLKKRLILPRGYHLYFIPKLSTGFGKTPKPQFRENPERVSGKPLNQFRENPERVSGKPLNSPHPTDTDIYRQQQGPAAVLNPTPQKAPPSLPELLELHLKITGAQPNEGLRRAVLNHLNECHISGWKLADLERIICDNRLNAVKKNIYDLVKPLSELDRAKKRSQEKTEHLRDLEKRGCTCGNCRLWKKAEARDCNNEIAFWWKICSHEGRFERLKNEP